MSFVTPFSSFIHQGFQSAGIAVATTAPVTSTEMPAVEKTFWHTQYRFEPYFVIGRSFDQYYPAYQLGWEAAQGSQGKSADFETLDRELNQRWLTQHDSSLLSWSQVKLAVKAAWERGIRPQFEDLLSPSASKKLVLVLEAARHFRESSVSYLASGHDGMQSEALQRFSLVSAKLLTELEALPAQISLSELAAARRTAPIFERSLQVWRDSRFMSADRLQDVIVKLQRWLSVTESLCQDALPAQARKLLRHHMLVLRGQLQAVQWLSHGTA